MRIVAAIDPGWSTGGQVWVDAATDRVLAAGSYTVKPAERDARKAQMKERVGQYADTAFAAAVEQARAQAEAMAADFDRFRAEHGDPVVCCVESFNDQPSRVSKKAQAQGTAVQRDRWTVPLVIGFLVELLERRGYTVADGTLVFQDAGRVMGGQFAVELAALKAGGADAEDVAEGASAHIRNEHQRSAWAHAAYRALRV